MEPRRPRKGDVTREALMTAAFKVFAAKGFLRTTVGDVVREAGKSTGVFHVYFRNKDALLDAWLERCDQMVPWYQADTSLLFEKARFFTLESYWALYERYGPVMRALEDAARASEHFAGLLAERQQKGDAGIARMIRHAQREGRCLGVDAELTAVSLGAMMSRTTAYWFAHRAELEGRGFDAAAALAHLEGLYARMLEPETVSVHLPHSQEWGSTADGREGAPGGARRATLAPSSSARRAAPPPRSAVLLPIDDGEDENASASN